MMEFLLDLDTQLLLWFNGSDSLFLDGLFSVLTSGFTWIPVYVALLYVVIKNNETMAQILLVIACAVLCVALTAGITNLIVKPLFARPRPLNDLGIKYLVDVVSGLGARNYSFWSAHAANTASLTMFFILLVRNKAFAITMVLWSLLNCYTRLYLGVHYPSDILVGLLFGCVMGFLSYLLYIHLYYKISPRLHYVSSHYTETGYSIYDVNIVISVMVFMLLYAVIRAVVIAL